MKRLLTFILIISCFTTLAQVRNYTVDTIRVYSQTLKENRKVISYTPNAISSSEAVTFLYLIDGEFSDERFRKIKEHFNGSIPNLIVAGIVNTDRRRDLLYVNSADKFLEFITGELIPLFEKDRKSSGRILLGHSFGGGFTIYSMINKPRSFNCYIASSPTPIMDLIKKEDYLKIDEENKEITFIFTYGSQDIGQVREWAQKLKVNLSGLAFKNLDWRFKIFEGKDHDNSDIPALIDGLELFFHLN